jgi:hypothetical protein
MLMANRRFWILVIGLTAALGAAFFVLPSLGHAVFLSPDETANAVTTFQLVPNMALPDFPSFHPRSFVYHEARRAPVGFLGIPLLMRALTALLSRWMLVLTTPVLAMSVVIPLLSFTKKWGRTSQVAAVVSWLTFPTVILYANRGLFPNLPVVCLTVWAAWLLWKFEKNSTIASAGLLTGIALVIRPVEAVWVLPWVGLAFLQHVALSSLKQRAWKAVTFLAPCLFVCFLGAIVGHSAYGDWLVAGYQLRDPNVTSAIGTVPVTEAVGETKSWFDTWPFGFHPRNIWFNVKEYLILYLLPWFVLTLGAVLTLWREKKWRIPLLLAAYTIVALSCIYGEALYQDHVGVNQIALANSFLRYLLPLSVFATVAVAWLATWILTKLPRGGRVVVAMMVLCLGMFGLWTAFSRDDEGLVQTRLELAKYGDIRARAKEVIPTTALVASERSDKIFFPTWEHVVSPLPPKDQLHQFVVEGEGHLALFLRTLTPAQVAEWEAAGLHLTPVLSAGNETLYLANAL